MGEWKAFKKTAGTGQKELEHEAGTGWKALLWEGVAIDVGGACEDRASYTSLLGITLIDLNNAANVSGTLTNICLWINTTGGADWHVGVFHLVSGITYKCRSAANLGALSVGENNKVVSLTIQTGDFIGVYSASGEYIESDNSGAGHRHKSGNQCVVDSEESYDIITGKTLSLYGTG